MADETILLADDDPMIIDPLALQLRREGFVVHVAVDGEDALAQARAIDPDVVLLDIMMPKKQGWEVCRELRAESGVPIIMLTARGEEMDRILGLELGADDYLTKPFSARELIARIRAVLRRVAMDSAQQTPPAETAPPEESAVVQLRHVSVNRARYQVAVDDEPVHLSQREYSLLIALLDAQGAAVKRGDLVDQVWGAEWIGDPRTLDVHMRWLRAKLERDPSKPELLLTIRGVGYRLIAPDEIADHK
ncbi:MAG: response regulator transcription factor [Caldilineaceae bacterium]|nr:response regulator transcription factor [Caldilineaceae bacterium]